jgi:hypothetical protein
VVATGASELEPDEYLYGEDPRVVTSLELDRKMLADDAMLDGLNTAVFIQCVGSREPQRPYCSRVCCTHSIESALAIKTRNPEAGVYILYRDIRTYGERETLYKKAREAGVIFIRYDLENKPQVSADGDQLAVRVTDHVLGLPVEITTDLLTLAAAIVPYADEQLSQFFKIPLNDDGFFVENTPSWDRANLPRTVCSSAGWPITPNPSTRPSPREKRRHRGPSPCWPRRTSLPAAKSPRSIHRCAPAAGCAYPSAPTRPQLHRGGCAHVRRQGNHQPGPVQGMRPVRGLLPVRRHPSQGIRQQPDFCHARCHLIEKRTGGGTGGGLPAVAGRALMKEKLCLNGNRKLWPFCATGAVMAQRIWPVSAGCSIHPTSGSSGSPAPVA